SALGASANGHTDGLGRLGNILASVTSPGFLARNMTAGTAKKAFDELQEVTALRIDAAASLGSNLTKVRVARQTSSDAMPTLTSAINDLAVRTIFGSADAAAAFERMARQGFTMDQALYGMGAHAGEYKDHAYDAKEATSGLGY